MKKKYVLFVLFLLTLSIYGQANFNTSLHATREGKNEAYRAESGGMFLITDVPMADLACQKCHSATEKYPDGSDIDKANYQPSCKDCHDFTTGSTVQEQTCINCHNRQKYERAAYPGVDVHQAKGLTCINCHSKEEIHGDDGVAYVSLKQEGAIKVKCEDCHTTLASNTSHNIHAATVDCAACHATAVVTCASCHFETVKATGINRTINQLRNYKLLVKKNGEIRLGGFMSHTYNGKTNFIISSYHSHAITKNATECADCHFNMGGTNAAIGEYNSDGKITLTKWNETTKKIDGPTGVVPIPADWKTSLKLDFATYTGDPLVFPSDANLWVYLKSEVDNSHLFYAEPLDSSTLAKLGFTRFPVVGVETLGNEIPTNFNLTQNYPNPFNPTTNIEYSIAKPSKVSLMVYDAIGNQVKSLVNSSQNPGNYKVQFNGDELTSGIYFATLITNDYVQTIKMLLIK